MFYHILDTSVESYVIYYFLFVILIEHLYDWLVLYFRNHTFFNDLDDLLIFINYLF